MCSSEPGAFRASVKLSWRALDFSPGRAEEKRLLSFFLRRLKSAARRVQELTLILALERELPAHGASRKPILARSGSTCSRRKTQDTRLSGAEAPSCRRLCRPPPAKAGGSPLVLLRLFLLRSGSSEWLRPCRLRRLKSAARRSGVSSNRYSNTCLSGFVGPAENVAKRGPEWSQ